MKLKTQATQGYTGYAGYAGYAVNIGKHPPMSTGGNVEQNLRS